jgi:hypothetical protein
MEYIEFTNQWQAFFKTHGLCAFEDFFVSFDGTQINKNSKRSVMVRTITDNGQEYTFFLKRFFNPHFKDMLFSLYQWRRPCSQGRLEWNCANYLLQHGVKTYQPACFGQIVTLGIERCSFFLTEKLPGVCLTDFFRQHWHSLDLKAQTKILYDLAAFIRKIHGLRVSLPDLYAYHLFIDRMAESSYSFAVIDLHRMSVRVPTWRMPSCRIENLARLNFSLRSDYVNTQLRESFLRECLGNLPSSHVTTAITKIYNRSASIAKRRKLPNY